MMLQGTGSGVGKSLIVAGLCRAYRNRGLEVRPFKPQNMSNNAAVTPDGGEIGRAQATQARACGVAPSVDMNPVLLKPQSEHGAQIVLRGRVIGQASAGEYQDLKPELLPAVLDSFATLCEDADLVLVEGAGSAAEINLRKNDIANMGFARAGLCSGDFGGRHRSRRRHRPDRWHQGRARSGRRQNDRGVSRQQVSRRSGPVCERHAKDRGIDRMAGPWAYSVFARKRRVCRRRTSLGLSTPRPRGGPITIAVPVLPGIANFDDLDPFYLEGEVRVVMVKSGETLPAEAALVILPGSKTTIAGLAAFRREGWDIDLFAHLRRGGHVFGLCGGYQMLGKAIRDPAGVEGPPGEAQGLGLLDIETELLKATNCLRRVQGTGAQNGVPFTGYEMHVGRSFGPDCARPVLRFADGRSDGATSADGRVSGCYVHGLFAERRATKRASRPPRGQGFGRLLSTSSRRGARCGRLTS